MQLNFLLLQWGYLQEWQWIDEKTEHFLYKNFINWCQSRWNVKSMLMDEMSTRNIFGWHHMLHWKSHPSSYLGSSVVRLISGQNLHVKLLLPESREQRLPAFPFIRRKRGKFKGWNECRYCIVAHTSSCNIPWSVIARDTTGRGPPYVLAFTTPILCFRPLSL